MGTRFLFFASITGGLEGLNNFFSLAVSLLLCFSRCLFVSPQMLRSVSVVQWFFFSSSHRVVGWEC